MSTFGRYRVTITAPDGTQVTIWLEMDERNEEQSLMVASAKVRHVLSELAHPRCKREVTYNQAYCGE